MNSEVAVEARSHPKYGAIFAKDIRGKQLDCENAHNLDPPEIGRFPVIMRNRTVTLSITHNFSGSDFDVDEA